MESAAVPYGSTYPTITRSQTRHIDETTHPECAEAHTHGKTRHRRKSGQSVYGWTKFVLNCEMTMSQSKEAT
ncbi:hypothetical protein PC128_g6749 [Phytophthora cactorum]|nr:hypothetical protein PC128_g6749 [Phytophthora cactorum]